jgi:hypothetical protein
MRQLSAMSDDESGPVIGKIESYIL